MVKNHFSDRVRESISVKPSNDTIYGILLNYEIDEAVEFRAVQVCLIMECIITK